MPFCMRSGEGTVENLEHVQDAVLAPHVSAAHAADADKRPVKRPWHAIEAAKVVMRVPTLQHRHEAVCDAALLAAAAADHVQPHGARDAV